MDTFSMIVSVRPAPGQPWRHHVIVGLVADAERNGGAARMVARYVAQRYGSAFPVVEVPNCGGEWFVYNGTPDGRAQTPYATMRTDTPRERRELCIPDGDAARVIVLNRDATAHPASNGEPYIMRPSFAPRRDGWARR